MWNESSECSVFTVRISCLALGRTRAHASCSTAMHEHHGPRCTIHTQPTCNVYTSERRHLINELDILKRLVGLIHLHILNCMNELQPRNLPPENRMLLIQPPRDRRRAKELTPGHPRSSVRHGHNIRSIVLQITSLNSLPQMLLPSVPSLRGSPFLITNIACWNDAVEDHTFEAFAPSATDEVLDSQRDSSLCSNRASFRRESQLWEQPDWMPPSVCSPHAGR